MADLILERAESIAQPGGKQPLFVRWIPALQTTTRNTLFSLIPGRVRRAVSDFHEVIHTVLMDEDAD